MGRGSLKFGFVVAAAAVCGACGAAPRDQADAGIDAVASLCGNDHWDQWPDGQWENCDEGPLNGTPEGRCTKQCNDALGPATPPWGYVDLGVPIAKAQLFEYDTQGRYRMAVTNFDAGGIHLFHSAFTAIGLNPRPALTSLMVQSPPVTLGRLRTTPGALISPASIWPAWIEVPTGESPRLYFAEIPDAGAPIIHEIPYPFPDGTKPAIVGRTQEDAGVLIIDQSATGAHDLLIAMVIVRSPGDVKTFTQRVPAPSGTRGIAVDTGWYFDYVERRAGTRQVVQFFNDPGSFVTIDIRLPAYPDMFVSSGSVRLEEVARGAWPYRVLSGDTFWKGCLDQTPEFTHPLPLVVLADTGDILTWQFDRGVEGETFVAPFARVSGGVRTVLGGLERAAVLEPDGSFVLFTDGDCRDLRSTALAPSRGPYTKPWTISTMPDRSSSDQELWTATADTFLYFY